MDHILSKTEVKKAAPRDAVTGDPVRVLVVAPSFDILGGQAVQAARLITRLREAPEFAVGFLPINPRLPGVLRTLQAIKYLRTVVTSLAYITSLFLKIPRYDVIHIFSASYFSFVLAPTPAILIAKLFGKKSLLNYHSGEAGDHFNRWPSAIRTIRLADRVAVPSAYLVRVLAKFRIESVAINNLIELEQFTFRERPQLRPRFLANRNLETHYGVDQALRAFALIQKEVPDAELLVAGDGSRRDALVRLAGELGLRQTRFTGRVEQSEIIAQYQQADIYLNGSEIDNQPLSILEAFACGLPVVTTDAGGIPDMISDGETGLLVKRGDHEALAKRALQLLSEPALASAMAKRAHAECERYSWAVVRGQWQELYFDLVNRPAEKPRATNVVKSGRLARLRKMGVAELRVRGSQATAMFAERRGWSSLTTLPSDQALLKLFVHPEGYSHLDLLAYFRGRTHVAFFGLTARAAVVAELRRRWPEAEQEIVVAAERIVAGRFDLLGFKQLSFGNPIDWRLEPVSGKSTPLVHWSKLDYLNPEITGDKKIVWELNRHQYFLKLGQAYWLTGAEKYAETFVAQLSSWMDQNPPKLGINWASSLEVSFRSISWLWALHFFKDSPALTASIFARVLKFLYLSARHLETYLSTYFSPNTHLTGEALGLCYLGTFLPEFSEAARWRRTGQKILIEQLAKQVKPDGVFFEQSSYYHRYTTDFYTHLFIILRHAAGAPGSAGIMPASHTGPSDSVDSTLTTTLTALLDHLLHLTRPDGTSPLFGDDDGGRLVTLDRRTPNDFRAALSSGAVLFNRGDYKFVAGSLAEETLWLLGPRAAAAFDEITPVEPSQQSRDFPDGGYYIMRDGWHARANYLLFDCGPHGASNCGHAHADALAIEVTANGQPLLIDPGTCSYTGAKDVRDWFRSSQAHNALTVDNESSSVPAGPFSWNSLAQCEPISWLNERRFDYVAGRHNGYARLPLPTIHTRGILFLKQDYWVMRDTLSDGVEHKLDLRFQFAAGTDPQIQPGNSLQRGRGAQASSISQRDEGAGLQLFAFGPEGQWRREASAVSECYGRQQPAPAFVYSVQPSHASVGADRSTELITLLLPNAGHGSEEFVVREVEAIGGRAFEITRGEYSDLLMLRSPRYGQVETVRLASDFDWTWVRFSRSAQTGPSASGELLELVALAGRRLEFDGKEILKSAKQISYLTASRSGDRFQVETSAGLLDLSFPIHDLEQLLGESSRQLRLSN